MPVILESENEWRAALYQDARPEIGGIDIGFDLNHLIEEVYVGPRAEDFFYDAVKSVMERYQLEKPLQRSALLKALPRAKAGTDLQE